MSQECTHDCSTCSQNCSERKPIEKESPHAGCRIKKVIGIVSGKGGVGKSLVTSLLAVSMRRKGYSTAILDADMTGPSIPKAFGLSGNAMANEEGILPVESRTGIKVMSVNLLLEDVTAPVVWRGPVIAGAVKQFWSDVIWGDVDYMFIDMPPGTGDVPLTVFQSLPVDGIVVVTSPQDLVGMVVEKALTMAKMMNIPVLGLVENMSYVQCPHCDEKIRIFGESHIDEIASRRGLKVLAQLPIQPELASKCDAGAIEAFTGDWLDAATDLIENI